MVKPAIGRHPRSYRRFLTLFTVHSCSPVFPILFHMSLMRESIGKSMNNYEL
jgi:hypothetical protein